MSGRITRRGGFLAAAGALGVVMALVAPAFACTELAQLSASPAAGDAGTLVTISGTQFNANREITVRWGGGSGTLLATATTDSQGSFGASFRVPDDVVPGQTYAVVAVQSGNAGRDVPVTFRINGGQPAASPAPPAPAPAPAPSVAAPSVAASQPATVTQPAATASPAPAAAAPSARQTAAPMAVATPVAAGPVAAQPAGPAPAPVPQAVLPADLGAIREPVAPAQPLVISDPASMGSPRTIDGGPSLWALVPLVLLGLTLFAAASAVVVHEVRARRDRHATVKA